MKTPDFTGYKFLSEGGRACNILSTSRIMRQYLKRDSKWIISLGAIQVLRNHKAKWFFYVRDESEFSSYLDNFVKDMSLLKKLESYIAERRNTGLKILSKDLTKLDNLALSKVVRAFEDNFELLCRSAGTLRFLDRALRHYFKQSFKEKSDEMLRILSVSDKPSFAIKEELKILNLANKTVKEKLTFSSKEFRDSLLDIYNNYCWSSCGYHDEKAKSIEDYMTHIKELNKSNPEKLIKEIEENALAFLKERKEAIKDLDIQTRKIAEITAESTFLKDYYKFVANELTFKSESLYNSVAKKTNKKVEFIKDIFAEEIVHLLQGKKIDDNYVKERAVLSVYIVKDHKLTTLIGREADEFDKKYFSVDNKDKNQFKGRSASKGYGKGRAKVILEKKDFIKFKEGDILVTTNTSPDFLPLMKKSAAIVSTEGGLTSHTSVVSREFNIPCIVGLDNITELIKDGDLIEVDANKGIVKILERAK